MKYCSDCKHFYRLESEFFGVIERCRNPDARTPVGHFQDPEDARKKGGACGPAAKLFEPKPPEPPPEPPRPGFFRRLFT